MAQLQATQLTDMLGSVVQYAGMAAVGRGMVHGFYGLSGSAFHLLQAVEAALAAGTYNDSKVRQERDKIVTHLKIAFPGLLMVAAGFALRAFGEYSQSSPVHDLINKVINIGR
jgi:hypothetical protein